MLSRLILFLCLTSLIPARAQFRHMIDTIRYDLKQKKSFFVCLDGKNSVIRDFPVNMFGLQAGYTYNNRSNFFIGFYNAYNDKEIIANPTARFRGLDSDSNTVWQKLRLRYLNIGCEYYFYDTRKWRLAIPASIGVGTGLIRQYNTESDISRKRYTVLPLELGFSARYKLSWWVWAGAGIGTRISLASGKFNGPFYTYGLSLRFGEIYERFSKWYNTRE